MRTKALRTEIPAVVLFALLLFTSAVAFAGPGTWKSEWPKTDFAMNSVDYDEILSGGPPKDGIPAIDNPKFVGFAEAPHLADSEPVVGLIVNGDRDTLVTVESSDPGAVSVQPGVWIEVGSAHGTFQVTAIAPADEVAVTATLPANLGSGSDTSQITVLELVQDNRIPVLNPVGTLVLIVMMATAGVVGLRRMPG